MSVAVCMAGIPFSSSAAQTTALNESGDVVVLSPLPADLQQLIYLDDHLTVSGEAKADSVRIYWEDELVGTAPVTGTKFTCEVEGLSQADQTAALRVIGVVDGQEMTDKGLGLSVQVGGDVVAASDAYVSRVAALGDSFRRNSSANGGLAIGGGSYTSEKGFEIHPKNGKEASAYAEIDIPVEGRGYTYFQSYVGRNAFQGSGECDDVECIVLADGVEVARSGQLAGQTVKLLCATIPAGAKLITLRTTNYDGIYNFGSTNWLNPTLALSRECIYRDGVKMYDESQESQVIDLNGANMQFKALQDFNALGLELETAAENQEITVKLYRWASSYYRTINDMPVVTGITRANGNMAFVDFSGFVAAGEYLAVIEGEGAIRAYTSDQFYRYDKEQKSQALRAQLVFTRETERPFGIAVPSFGSTALDVMAPTKEERQRVEEEYRGFLSDNLKNFPMSFCIDGKEYFGFGVDFTLESQKTETQNDIETTVTQLKHTSGLVFEVTSVYYPNYNAYDWVTYISNDTGKNSPVISGINAADLTLRGKNPYLFGNYGDSQQYKPYTVNVDGSYTTSSKGGRSTQANSSYFNLEYGSRGVLYAIGWPGQWSMTLDNSENPGITRLVAGQESFSSYLKNGETIRTPLMAFVHYDGQDQDRATNLWRHWMIDCNMHRVTQDASGEGELKLMDPMLCASSSFQYGVMTMATDQNQIDAIRTYQENGIKLNYWWMDAGWYYNIDNRGNYVSLPANGWPGTGVWKVDDTKFPSKFLDISNFAKSYGMKTLLWFEPERSFAPVSGLKNNGETIRREWLISDVLVNMGNSDAVDWFSDRIISIMREGGISLYREDFNIEPLSYWKTGDRSQGKNRDGITENLYVQGHLKLWDRILEAFPDAVIDSCASGGNRNDLETMRRAVPLHKTDYGYGDRPAQQGIATEMSRWIPYFGTKANGEGGSENNNKTANRYSLRTAMASSMVLDYITDSPVDWDIVQDITQEHAELAAFNYGDYYVLSNWSRSESDWAAWEYYCPDQGRGYAMVYRRNRAATSQKILLKGLETNATYKIWFEDANKPAYYTGQELMLDGLEVSLPADNTSDIIHIAKKELNIADRRLTAKMTQISENGQYQGALRPYDGYYRADIRFNMSLRDTVLKNRAGIVETGVEQDYTDTILLNGKSIGEILSEDAQGVYLDYDVSANILRVYAKEAYLNWNQTNEITVSEALCSDGGAVIDGKTTFYYSPMGDVWSQETVPSDSESSRMGDVNGDGNVDASDALLVLQHSVSLTTLNEQQQSVANVNADNTIDASDALLILQRSVGLIDGFPAE